MVIAASTLLGMLINFSGINPMSALFWTAVINGLVSPPLLVVIMLVSNNKKVMGDKVNGLATNLVGLGCGSSDVRSGYRASGYVGRLDVRQDCEQMKGPA